MVARHFKAHIFLEGIIIAKAIYGDRVVNHQIHRRQGVHLMGIAAEALHSLAHGSQVHHCRYTGKILHQHTSGTIGYLPVGMGVFQPIGQRLDVVGSYRVAILPAQKIFQ